MWGGAGRHGRGDRGEEEAHAKSESGQTDVAAQAVALEPLLPAFGSLHVRARPPELRGGHLADVLFVPDHASPHPARVVKQRVAFQDQRSGDVGRALDVVRVGDA